MLFNSIEFLVFFPVVTLLYFLLRHKYRWQLLLGASIIFYMSFVPKYIIILAITVVIDYFAGILIEKSEGRKRFWILWGSIIANLMILFVFKYFNFFNTNVAKIAELIHWNYPISSLSLILPVGLSFYIFQSLSYVIEVYKGRQKAEKHFGIHALYVIFYPQLVAGPIERPQNLLPQFREKHNFSYERVLDGLKLMLWGFFKKLVIADRLAVIVNTVYSNPTAYPGTPAILATIFFAFQIYCDFSGYSDIAIGSAQVMGFRLMDNFNRPYFSKSISEFWKRWHISLSTWFKDYVYFPLGGSRVLKYRWYLNLLIVFLVSGLWHGANWTFVIWGGLHGFYIIFSLMTSNIREKIKFKSGLYKFPKTHQILKIIITFTLVCFAWIFFRANNLSNAIFIITHLFSNWNLNVFDMNLKVSKADLLLSFFFIFFMEMVHIIQRHGSIRRKFLIGLPKFVRWIIYISLILFILLFGVFKEVHFIYFQF